MSDKKDDSQIDMSMITDNYDRTNSVFSESKERVASVNLSNINLDLHLSPRNEEQSNRRYNNFGSEDSIISNNLYAAYEQQLEKQGIPGIPEVSASKEQSMSTTELSRANPSLNLNTKQSAHDQLIVEEDEEEADVSVYLERVRVENPKITT